ncbi:MAG: hemerythrin domain-containing protein [Planctomycetes bacterium]|nr:hemerythrin domain-containing protein [Planctomycetota bacterium]
MERPTDHLKDDHVLAARAVRALAAIAARVRDGHAFPADDTATVLRFLREWVVAVHMRKEDEILGPAVAMRGDERAAEMVGELFRLHEEITELLHSLVLFWEPLGELTDAERGGFAETVVALIARLERRQHIEEQLLFPACDRFVPADDQLHWLEEFNQLEVERGARAEWSDRIDALATRWLD